jgi:hypothetical protein
MNSAQRTRRYVSRGLIVMLRPLLRYSATRDAYVLRAVGNRIGPVLREDRRRQRLPFAHERRRHPAR